MKRSYQRNQRNMKNKNILITFATVSVIALAIVAGLATLRSTVVNVAPPEVNLGATSGTDHYNGEVFHNTVDFRKELTLSSDNCTSASFSIPALSPVISTIGSPQATTSLASITGLATGDMLLLSWTPATGANGT